jgi:hypothetical protein
LHRWYTDHGPDHRATEIRRIVDHVSMFEASHAPPESHAEGIDCR